MRRAVLILLGMTLASHAYGKPLPFERPQATPEIAAPNGGQFTPAAAASFQDTVFFGGTMWAPDSMRWEALRDSVWTFDSGVGSWINTGQLPGKPLGYHGGMEGWSGFNPNSDLGIFERSSTCAISGMYSLWAGVDSATAGARCYAAGQGYGNDWWISRRKTFFYPGSGDITLSYDYRVESESGFDYVVVSIDTTGNGYDAYLTDDSGTVSGHETLTLTRADGTLPSTAGNMAVQFVVYSDASYSDEDGLFTSACGHTAIDNVRLSGAVNDFSDFESGNDGWVPGPESAPGFGDLSHIADIANLPPVQVPGPCAVTDSVLVFHDNTFRIPSGENWALSPWIDLRRNGCVGRPGKIVMYDLYSEYFWWPNGDNQLVRVAARSRPAAPCDRFHGIWRFFDLGPWCSSTQPIVADLSNLIDVNAEQVQIAIGVQNYRGAFSQSTDTPWFDNVRFGVYGTPTSNVPDAPRPPITSLVGATPNPFNSATRITFTMQSDGHVTITVFDVAGRRVRTLVDSQMPAGANEVTWDARDDVGLRVPTGLYFYRLSSGNFMETRKLVVFR